MHDEPFKEAETSREQHGNAIWHTLSDPRVNRNLNKMGCGLRRSMSRQKSQICHIPKRASSWIADVKSLLNWVWARPPFPNCRCRGMLLPEFLPCLLSSSSACSAIQLSILGLVKQGSTAKRTQNAVNNNEVGLKVPSQHNIPSTQIVIQCQACQYLSPHRCAEAGGENFPLQPSVSVRDGPEVIITHAKRMPCIVETSIAS